MLKGVAIVAAIMMLTMNLNAVVKVEQVEYKGWRNCWRVTNGEVELVVTGMSDRGFVQVHLCGQVSFQEGMK